MGQLLFAPWAWAYSIDRFSYIVTFAVQLLNELLALQGIIHGASEIFAIKYRPKYLYLISILHTLISYALSKTRAS